MNLKSAHLLVRDAPMSLDLAVKPQELGMEAFWKVHLYNGKFQASLSSGQPAWCSRDHCSPQWPLGSQVLAAVLSFSYGFSSLPPHFILASSLRGKGENDLSQPQGLGTKQPGNTGRGKDKPYTLALRSAPNISIFQYLLSLEYTEFCG